MNWVPVFVQKGLYPSCFFKVSHLSKYLEQRNIKVYIFNRFRNRKFGEYIVFNHIDVQIKIIDRSVESNDDDYRTELDSSDEENNLD